MVYNNQKYSFTNVNTVKDQVPTWMNDEFFNNLQNSCNSKMKKTANLFNVKANEHCCQCCGNNLNENEVNFCKSCIAQSIN